MKTQFKKIISLLLILSAQTVSENAAANKPFRISGYLKEMPAVQFDRNVSDPSFSNLLHLRLNTRWDISRELHMAAEVRNRLFFNEHLRNVPGIKDLLEKDDGLADMSWVWLHQGAWLAHSMADRLYVDWRHNKWQLRAGRQRINWGLNLVSNPNDLFNTYSFFDFDYVERPGTDAIRVQYHSGFASRIEVAWRPARKSEESTAALLLANNYNGYDIQLLAGYFRNRTAAGIGWAGHIGGAGFKGELSWFRDIEQEEHTARSNIVAAAGFDYMFGNGTFAILEFLYNGGYGRTEQEVFMINQPLRADNIMFSEYALTLSVRHPFSSVLHGSLALMALPDIQTGFIMPSLSYSLMTNLDLEFVAQIFAAKEHTLFEEAGSSCFLSVQYSF